jgi:hypothetical protein
VGTGVRDTPPLDQVFTSFRKAKEATTDAGGLNFDLR